MRLQLLYFAAVRELCGKSEETIEVPPLVKTVGDLATYLPHAHGELEGRLDQVRFAVNECFASRTDLLADGDVVAVIPPVSGG